MLWGAHAQSKARLVAGGGHLVLQCNHPSPLSATRPPVPFVGCGHFSRAAGFLAQADPRRPALGLAPVGSSGTCKIRWYSLRFASEGCPSG